MDSRTAPSRNHYTPREKEEVERFVLALREAMVKHRFSERKLGEALEITIGTTQKYFKKIVHPFNVSTRVNRNLALLLGVSIDGLMRYYERGDYDTRTTFTEVVSWLRSNAGQEHMAPILEAMSEVSQKGAAKEKVTSRPRYDWPMEELRAAEISDALRERMGLGDEVMERLAVDGEFDDALVEAFSVATNLEGGAVREAFSKRIPISESP
jgi:transcriptional regulator with XRE-family HTH domain